MYVCIYIYTYYIYIYIYIYVYVSAAREERGMADSRLARCSGNLLRYALVSPSFSLPLSLSPEAICVLSLLSMVVF